MSVTSLLRHVKGTESGETVRDTRPEIQALRAIAVGSVLLYHLWPKRLSGGYVGVDVFFVISGFLITSHLLREVDRSGKLRVGVFWARRARRLLPSSLIVLLATTVAISFVVPSSQWSRSLWDVIGSALYVENWRLAALSVDYLGANAAASPVQHFWTLSVEEQFYVALPLLLLVALWFSRVARLNRRAVMAASIGVVALVSLFFSVEQTPWSAAAYFTTHTRAWEFAVGALLAFVPPLVHVKQLATIAGVLGIAAAVVFFTDGTAFPGFAALLPVLGAALVLWAGRGTWLAWAGRVAPVAVVGRSSYAIYLWHWPMVVLVPYVTGETLTWPTKLVIAAVALLLAWLTTVLWEEPIRFSSRLLGGRRPRVVAMWSAGATILVVVTALSFLYVDGNRRAAAQDVADQALAVLQASGCAGAAAMVNSQCDPLAPAPVLIPPLVALADDDDNREDCWNLAEGSNSLPLCQVGSGKGPRFLVLGDSHSNSLLGVYERLAVERGWTFLVNGQAACYATTAHVERDTEKMQSSCDAWRESALKTIAEGNYDALIVTHASQDRVSPTGGMTADETEVAGMIEAWAMRPSMDIPVIAIRDNPTQRTGFDTCLDRQGPAGGVACGRAAHDSLGRDLHGLAIEADPNGHVIDLTDLYCVDGYCPVIVGGIVVYRPDGHHITATFAHTLAPMIGDRLEGILREQGILDVSPPATASAWHSPADGGALSVVAAPSPSV